jgi:hypothetical protein
VMQSPKTTAGYCDISLSWLRVPKSGLKGSYKASVSLGFSK